MMLRSTTRALCLTLIFSLVVGAPAQAGILDTIKGLFSGGASKVSSVLGGGSSDSELKSLLDKVEQSQSAVASKQQAVADLYNNSSSSIKPGDASLQAKLDELSAASRANEALYLQLLQTRSDMATNKKELSSDEKTRVEKLTSTQNQLESNYQKIQEVNKQAGLFTAPATAAASETVAQGSGTSGPMWLDEKAKGFMDEYLAKADLNGWGQWEGTTATAIVRAAGSPDAAQGRDRHEYLWNAFRTNANYANLTMEEYVLARMKGEAPDVQPTHQSSGGAPTPTPGGGGVGGGGVETVATDTPAPTGSGSDGSGTDQVAAPQTTAPPSDDVQLSSVEDQLKTAYDQLVTLQKDAKGDTDEAKALLKRIEGLQTQKASVIRRMQK